MLGLLFLVCPPTLHSHTVILLYSLYSVDYYCIPLPSLLNTAPFFLSTRVPLTLRGGPRLAPAAVQDAYGVLPGILLQVPEPPLRNNAYNKEWKVLVGLGLESSHLRECMTTWLHFCAYWFILDDLSTMELYRLYF